ncbi:uncharacterized protein LOC144607515 [Rhinoraja longicauda]
MTLNFNCGGLVGRYVTIIIPGENKSLTLCEVDIFGSELLSLLGTGTSRPIGNVASGARTTQSSTKEEADAHRASDGNSDTDFRRGSCSSTRKSKKPWWRLDLIKIYNVSDVIITNRADCCSDRLQGAEIHIGNSLENNGNSNRLCGTVDSINLTTIIFKCDGFVGRYVNIVIPGQDKILTLCEVEVLGTEVPYILGKENLASGARPIQSSTDEGADAGRANDGDTDSDFRHGSCARTSKSENPWWRVDLKKSHNVTDVKITNRADCCSDQLQGAEIRIGNSLENDGNSNRLCGTVNSVNLSPFIFNCGGLVGEYVNIIIPGHDKILTLCEVEIFGSELQSLLGTENVALGVPAAQSSTYRRAGAGRANDGNSDGDFSHGSCARTRKSNNPWWRVDLEESYKVSDVRITNRADCCSDWLKEAEIRIGNSLENNGNSNRFCGTVSSVSGTTLTFNCDGFVGRYVNIIIPGQDKVLTLCEVEIFGLELPYPFGEENVALGASPTQSSTDEGAVAERANDGNSDSDFRNGSCARTRKSLNPWWRVDLKESYNVSDVRITNRADCCPEQLRGAEIRIGESLDDDGNFNRLCGIVESASGTTFTFNCGGSVGRYVNVIIPGPDKILTLCEVEIFGSELPYLHGKENVALGASPTQSSTEEAAAAGRANDGNSDNDFRHGSCARTRKSKNPWWRVDLKESYNVSDVRITNRADCCSDQLRGAEIRIGDSLEYHGNFNRLTRAKRLQSSSRTPWPTISIKPLGSCCSKLHMQGLGNRRPSSLLKEMVALMDGHRPCLMFEYTYLHLLPADIRLQLADTRALGVRTDVNPAAPDFLRCGIVDSVSGTTFTFNCGVSVGRYVNIIIPGPDKILTLCEVEIFGSELPYFYGKENLALGASPAQSSTDEGAAAERANDGNSDSDFRNGSCARTRKSKNPWWRVDLKESYNVSGVRITNRADCCSDKLQGAEIRIGDSLDFNGNFNRLCGIVDSISGTTFIFNCAGSVGRYVNIIIPGPDKILTLCEVEIFGSELPYLYGKENLALGASPTQSSTDEGAAAQRANDGNSDSDFRHGSCARTRKSKDPWWRVDLKESYNVSDVRITNRADCCTDQLRGAEIRIGESLEYDGNFNRLCGIVESVSGTRITFHCGESIGRYVNIIIPGPDKILTLCEVEIFGSELPYLHGKENVALGATPTQSSTDEEAAAQRANDGNSDNDFRHGSCARTWKSTNPWWRVDLKESYNVSDVRITNRADCCPEQLRGAEIRIGDSLDVNGNFNRLCGIVDSVSATTLTFNCGGSVGRYVNVIIPGADKILTLCEVEIFGSELPYLYGKENVALGASPTQSSTDEGAAAQRANDGDSDSDFRHGSCSRTRKSMNPWWRVDLKESYNVSDVRITSRADCCSDQLRGAEIRIGDSLEYDGNFNRLCGIVDSVSGRPVIFNCGGSVGRYVNIIIPGADKRLTLCEVEIFGSELPYLYGKVLELRLVRT